MVQPRRPAGRHHLTCPLCHRHLAHHPSSPVLAFRAHRLVSFRSSLPCRPRRSLSTGTRRTWTPQHHSSRSRYRRLRPLRHSRLPCPRHPLGQCPPAKAGRPAGEEPARTLTLSPRRHLFRPRRALHLPMEKPIRKQARRNRDFTPRLLIPIPIPYLQHPPPTPAISPPRQPAQSVLIRAARAQPPARSLPTQPILLQRRPSA
jgi:hypothetical protein